MVNQSTNGQRVHKILKGGKHTRLGGGVVSIDGIAGNVEVVFDGRECSIVALKVRCNATVDSGSSALDVTQIVFLVFIRGDTSRFEGLCEC